MEIPDTSKRYQKCYLQVTVHTQWPKRQFVLGHRANRGGEQKKMGHALVSAAHPLSHSRHRVFPQEHSNVANSAGLSAVGVRPAMPAPRSALAPSGLSLGNPKRRHGGVGILSSSTRQGIGKKSKTIQIARIGWCKGISTPLVTRSTLRITAFRCGVAHYGRVGRPTRSLLLTTAVTITAVTVATLITSAAPLRLCGKPAWALAHGSVA